MPFDCAPSIDAPDPSTVGKGDLRNLVGASPIGAVRTKPIPWHLSRRLGLTLGRAALVPRILRSRLVRCPGTAPIGVGPALLRLGAIMRAGRELGAPTEAACKALKWQTVISVAHWNDHRLRIHAEVISAFDAAIAQLDRDTR
jgi:hypothetical protein